MCDESPVPAFSLSNMGRLVDSVIRMQQLGYKVVLVTSGAVGAGCLHMKLSKKPDNTAGREAVAAIGQCRIMRLYEDLFAIRESKVAQVLITRTDISDKLRFINWKNTLLQLLHMGVTPIINENDSLASNQLKFGDNDTLAAYCSISLGAQWLILLTDVDFLYTANPRHCDDAKPIPYVGHLEDVYKIVTSDTMGSTWGSGGMRTKIIAAKLASATGIKTALCHGKYPERVVPILEYFSGLTGAGELSEGELSLLDPATARGLKLGIGRGMDVGLVTLDDASVSPYKGTVFAAHEVHQAMQDQRRWLLSLPVRGKLYVDCGAAMAVINHKSSLMAAGIVVVEGEFYEGEAVSIYLADTEMVRREKESVCKLRRFEDQSQSTPELRKKDNADSPKLNSVASGNAINEQPAQALNFDGISEGEAERPEIARCLTNYTSEEIAQVKGLRSDQFEDVLGYVGEQEIADRSNIAFVNPVPLAWPSEKTSHSRHLTSHDKH